MAEPLERKLPPIWLLGMTNATFGFYGAFAVVTLPEMLAAQGIPGGRIAAIVATVLASGTWIFLLSPILDVRFSRRTYALVFALLASAGLAFTVAHRTNVALIEATMIVSYACVCMVQGAVGGWVGSLTTKQDDSTLGIWFAVSNIGAGGLMILAAEAVISRLSPVMAGLVLGGVIMLPSLLYLAIPAPGPDRRLAQESFRQFFGDIIALVRRREVLIALTLFLLPSASFALTNVLGGVGKDFRATEHQVSLLAGVGGSIAGIVGSFLLKPFLRRLPLRPAYLAIGVTGALFTLSLLLLPHSPTTFAVAYTGENLFQALAFAAANAITFETIGQGNPLAATQFSLLIAATNLPIIYMGFIDGRAYTWRGIGGSFLADAVISIVVCMLLAVGLRFLARLATVASDQDAGPINLPATD